MAAGGSDNWAEKTLGREIVHPPKPVGLSHVTHFNTECLPSTPADGSGFKAADINSIGLRRMFQDGENVFMCWAVVMV